MLTLLFLLPLASDPALVPWPKSVKPGDGVMPLTGRVLTRDPRLWPLAEILADELRLLTGLDTSVSGSLPRPGDVALAITSTLKGEAYRLAVETHASLEGAGYDAVAQGTATLLQAVDGKGVRRMIVEDVPAFPYRGALLDLARKPFSIGTLRKCIITCRFYKIRHLHLHMTDENAWVFPSTAYPKLGSQNFPWAGGEAPKPYPVDELRALVRYAERRGVILVPEIEMPGHSGQLRGTLPAIFGYKGKDGKPTSPGYINMVSEDAFAALDTILGEVASVFHSSPYIHIGCDEVSLGGIEDLPEVKACMAKHKLKSPHDVFNIFVNRMNSIVKKHGKRMIVWEGAPLGPVPPPMDVIFMPWVGGSAAAADLVKRGHHVINAPWGVKEAYFDPLDCNGARLKDGEPLLFGATSILWESPQEAAVPYLRYTGALRNEPTHNPKARRGHADFLVRHKAADGKLDRLLTGLAMEADGVLDPLAFMRPDALFTGKVTLSLSTAVNGAAIRYTLDGTDPSPKSPLYTRPITLSRSTTVKARIDGMPVLERTFRTVPAIKHDAVGAKVTITPDKPGYPGPGAKGLADGLLSDGDHTGSVGWVGWERGPVEVVMEFPKPVRVSKAAARFLRGDGGVALPARAEFAVSSDGKKWQEIGSVTGKDGARALGWYAVRAEPIEAKYLRLRAEAGGDWTFLDEVTVNADVPGPTFKHAARGLPVKLLHPPSPAYSACGVAALTDGHVCRSPEFLDHRWLGWEGKDFDASIDLGKAVPIREVGARFLQYDRAGISIPGGMVVMVSDDGKAWRQVAKVEYRREPRTPYLTTLSARLDGVKARHVRVIARTGGQWIFADEVFVNPE